MLVAFSGFRLVPVAGPDFWSPTAESRPHSQPAFSTPKPDRRDLTDLDMAGFRFAVLFCWIDEGRRAIDFRGSREGGSP